MGSFWFQGGVAEVLPVLTCSFRHGAFPPKIWLLQGTLWLRSSEAVHLSHETEDLLHLLVSTARLPRPTARRAATIEPTMQEPISKARALKNRPPSNSTRL